MHFLRKVSVAFIKFLKEYVAPWKGSLNNQEKASSSEYLRNVIKSYSSEEEGGKKWGGKKCSQLNF